MMRGIVFIILTVVALVNGDESDKDWWQLNKQLRDNLLKDYDINIIPQRTHNGSVQVYVRTQIRGMWLDEQTQVMHINLWFVMIWDDRRLRWDPKDYGGITMLHLGEKDVWKPDITVYNNADLTEIDHYGNTHILVYPMGNVLWVPPSHVRVECPMDLTYWPYDKQTCFVYFGSWTTHGYQINMNYANFSVEVGPHYNLKDSHKWQYTSGNLKRRETRYKGIKEPYITMILQVNMQRMSPSFTSTVVVPATVVSLVTLLQFLLPLTHPRRITIGCTALLMTLMELVYLAFTLPPMASSLPLIVKFYGQTLMVVAISVGVCASMLRLTSAPANSPPPAIIKNILTGPLASVLFLQNYTNKVGHSSGDGDGEVLEDSKTPQFNHEWLLVAAAVDRIAVIIFIAIFFITLIAYVAVI